MEHTDIQDTADYLQKAGFKSPQTAIILVISLESRISKHAPSIALFV